MNIPKPTKSANQVPLNLLNIDWMVGLVNTLNRLPFENKFN